MIRCASLGTAGRTVATGHRRRCADGAGAMATMAPQEVGNDRRGDDVAQCPALTARFNPVVFTRPAQSFDRCRAGGWAISPFFDQPA